MKRELYVENGVGRSIASAINLFTAKHGVRAVFQHDIHPAMQRPQRGDEWWIRDISGRGMAILTQDCAILESQGERQTVVDSGARVVALGNAQYDVWQKLRCLVTHWEAVEEVLNGDGPSAVTLWLSRVDVIELGRR
ncbi:MAG: hypothetical protein ACRDK4_02680 [Solirubrobacteraceae bacterium]